MKKLYILGGMVVSIIIAIFEFTWKQRKLAVDENVRKKHNQKIKKGN